MTRILQDHNVITYLKDTCSGPATKLEVESFYLN